MSMGSVNIGGGGGSGEAPKSFTIATSDWTSSSNSTYPYQADITIDSKWKSTDTAYIVFHLASLSYCTNANVAPSAESIDGAVRIYAKTKPTSSIEGVVLLFRS